MENNALNVIIVGCGRVGSGLATRLSEQSHNVTIIDKQESSFRRLPSTWRGSKIVGLGFDKELLERAGARNAHALLSVTSGDNSNIVTARIAREIFEIPTVVARIYDPKRAEIYQHLGIPTIATVPWAIDQIERRLFPQRTKLSWSSVTADMHLVEKIISANMAGRDILSVEENKGVRVVGYQRALTSEFIDAEPFYAQEGDIIYIMVKADALGAVEDFFK